VKYIRSRLIIIMNLSTIQQSNISASLISIAEKVINQIRITDAECLTLYNEAELGFVGWLANIVRERKNGNRVYFNRNFHIEPTNLCVFHCKFCSYSRTLKEEGDGWFMTQDQMLHIVEKYKDQPVTEVHIVGGVHPKLTVEWFAKVLQKIKAIRPDLHIKGFTAVELEYMFRKAKMSYTDGMKYLNEHGLDSIPGGGAEIFDEEIRNEICPDKANAEEWLGIHQAAHKIGMHSNATMLYGHIEKFEHRIDHMSRLRNLQDETKGFNTFIPLKFRKENNEMNYANEVTIVEDLRNYAISRIYLDNFNHIKAYWPMIGRQTAQLSLAFGVDDLDGTIDDSTKIYSMAGSEEKNPSLTTEQLVQMIKEVGRTAVERDTLYGVVNEWN
jgi:aminodeoxyfutalosine synthase